MGLIIQCVVFCILFTVIIIPSLYKNPIVHIMSYPTAIRKRVESLPQYKDVIQAKERRHIMVKIAGLFIVAILCAAVAYFSGAKNFTAAFIHVFTLFFAVNIYDVLVLDIGIFCHSKKVRIPGTEDMDREYRSPWHHIRGAVIGTFIGAAAALSAGGIVYLISIL